MSRTFSTNIGSLESLKVSTRCGCSEKACQMRWMVEGARPAAWAIERRLQWVAFAGVVSSVRWITSAILASPIVRGAPGRGSSDSPSSLASAKRVRHLPTVCWPTPSAAAIALLILPSAASNTIRARHAKACAVPCRRTSACSSDRSPSDSVISTALPRAILPSFWISKVWQKLIDRDTSVDTQTQYRARSGAIQIGRTGMPEAKTNSALAYGVHSEVGSCAR